MPVTRTAAVTAPAEPFPRQRPRLAAVLASVLAAATVAGCTTHARTYQVGAGAPDTSGYVRAYTETGGAEAMGEPTTGVETWSFGCRQLFSKGGSMTAVLLQQPCGRNQQVFAVTGDFLDLYQQSGGKAPARYGFPLGRRGEWKDGWTQGFGRRGSLLAFFMQRPGQPPHVLAAPILQHYLSFDDRDVRFGYPTSEQFLAADGRWCQRFEHGVLTAADDDDPVPVEGASSREDAPSTCGPWS